MQKPVRRDQLIYLSHSCSRKTQFLSGCCRTDWLAKCQQKNLSLMLKSFCNVYLIADPCYNNQNMGDGNRKGSYTTLHWSGPVFCDDLFPERWYRFKGAVGTSQLFQSR